MVIQGPVLDTAALLHAIETMLQFLDPFILIDLFKTQVVPCIVLHFLIGDHRERQFWYLFVVHPGLTLQQGEVRCAMTPCVQ